MHPSWTIEARIFFEINCSSSLVLLDLKIIEYEICFFEPSPSSISLYHILLILLVVACRSINQGPLLHLLIKYSRIISIPGIDITYQLTWLYSKLHITVYYVHRWMEFFLFLIVCSVFPLLVSVLFYRRFIINSNYVYHRRYRYSIESSLSYVGVTEPIFFFYNCYNYIFITFDAKVGK